MAGMPAAMVDAEQRADEEDAGAGGANDVGEAGADGEDGGIDARRRGEVADDENAARDGIEGGEHEDKAEIGFDFVAEMAGALPVGLGTDGEEIDTNRRGENEAEDCLIAIGVPPTARDERQDCDAEQQENEWNSTNERKRQRFIVGK